MRGMHSIVKSHQTLKLHRTISRENLDRIERDKRLAENALKRRGDNGNEQKQDRHELPGA